MKKTLLPLAVLLAFLTGCEKPVIEKPRDLVSRDKMISMLVDIRLVEAIYQTKRFSSEELRNLKEADFYYSVLKIHGVADSTFEKSLIYYSSKPKEFEKIYTRVVNRLTQMEQELEEKSQKPVDIGNSGSE